MYLLCTVFLLNNVSKADMKTIKGWVIIGIFFSLCSSCRNEQKNKDSYLSPSVTAISTEEIPEKDERTQIDKLFDDFIYNFTSDSKLQRQRILFPLSYNNLNYSSKIQKKDWQHDSLYAKENSYTLIFEKEEDMELPKDTSLTSVQMEWILPESHIMKKYCFRRIKETWYLEAINVFAYEKGEGENFIDFFFRFSNDTSFQQKRIKEPLTFVTNDPDDDFSIIKTTLALNQWIAFKPEFPTGKISNIDYGQQNNTDSRKKIVALKSVGNGFSNTLYFQRKQGKWELYKFEDISN
ncbi:hypothetical protein EZS27_023112 [termite gut metagenome]|uniref:DUF4348 domain-containing protein n=1 Tax=termite gut metagenome TaxID=433724 RepID=A0A5J4R1E0_9ZZZZ